MKQFAKIVLTALSIVTLTILLTTAWFITQIFFITPLKILFAVAGVLYVTFIAAVIVWRIREGRK